MSQIPPRPSSRS